MQEIAAYLTFVMASIALIFSVVAAIAVLIGIYQLTKWVRRLCRSLIWHKHTYIDRLSGFQ